MNQRNKNAKRGEQILNSEGDFSHTCPHLLSPLPNVVSWPDKSRDISADACLPIGPENSLFTTAPLIKRHGYVFLFFFVLLLGFLLFFFFKKKKEIKKRKVRQKQR